MPLGQQEYAVRFDWGPAGAARLAAAVLVVVDVLSFSTSVSVVVERGGTVMPAAWRDERARALADERDAVLAVGRREMSADHPWSLSPAALQAAPVPPRLVLPSPNGSAIAAASNGNVVAGCLRNAAAVADRLAQDAGPIAVVAAGERWPDGSLRPALEDLLGAGAVLSGLLDRGVGGFSPDARAAVAAYRGIDSVPEAVRTCASGRELHGSGFAEDVEIALQTDASGAVPLLRDGFFTAD